jgi:negative regulator of sigma E activity
METLKESVSALMDDEASEIEVHRLLRELEADEAMRSTRATWVSYSLIRSVLRRERVLSGREQIELHQRISAAIDQEKPHDQAPKLARSAEPRRYVRPVVGFAVAASLVAAILTGILVDRGDRGESMDASVALETPIDVRPTAYEPANAQRELKELTEDQQRQLKAYLNQHEQMARMDPNLRTAVFPKQSGN